MSGKTIGTALAKELCLLCTTEMDGPIFMNKIMTEHHAKKVEDMHGQIIGYAPEPCQECKDNMEKAFMFIGFEEDKSDMDSLPGGFFRSGHIVGVKKNIPLVQEWVKENVPGAVEKGYMFMPHIIMEQFGLIKLEEK